MNAAYIHITLNTIPPILNVTGLLILMVGWKNAPVARTGMLLLLAAALVGVPTYLSGEGAEEIVEKLEGVNATAIEPHEEAAKYALVLSIVQAVAVLAALFVRKKALTVAVVAIAIIATATVFRTAYLGGRIHHPETQMKG